MRFVATVMKVAIMLVLGLLVYGTKASPTENDNTVVDGGCVCAEIYHPVCGEDGVTYGNACHADCQGVAYTDGECVPVEDPSGCAAVLCPAIVAYVCGANNKTYINSCMAECSGIKKYTKGECLGAGGGNAGSGIAVGEPNPSDPCPCTKQLRPVCGSDAVTYANPCLALCAGIKEHKDGSCSDGPSNQEDATSCPLSEPVAACLLDPCSLARCPAHPRATCFSNLCKHKYRNVTLDQVCEAYFYDPATGDILDCDQPSMGTSTDDCVCMTFAYEPVCGVDGNTYPSTCNIECAKVKVAYKGECAKQGADCICTKELRPVCGSDGVTYPNPCMARCAGMVDYKDGECKTSADDPASCPDDAPVAQCFKAPCQDASCPANPEATCFANLCKHDYRGVTLDKLCQPYFYNVTTGELVNCEVAAPNHPRTGPDGTNSGVSPCSGCTKEYMPVCASDGNTYPNSCTATCNGLEIISPGKCNTCKGASCKCAAKGEICLLGGSQCCNGFKCTAPTVATAPGVTSGMCKRKKARMGTLRRSLLSA